jgi:hypothetical protein
VECRIDPVEDEDLPGRFKDQSELIAIRLSRAIVRIFVPVIVEGQVVGAVIRT